MKRTLFFIFAALLCCFSASAQEQKPSSYEKIELADENDVKTFTYEGVTGVHAYEFTAPATGIIEFHVGYSSMMIYSTDRAYTEDTKQMLAKQDDSEGNFYFMEVEAGKTYYFTTSVLVDPQTIKVKYGTGDPGIKIDSNMTDGSLYSITGRNLELTVDRTVNVEEYSVIYTSTSDQQQEETIPTEYINVQSGSPSYITINLASLMDYLMDGGKIDFGANFTIKLSGISDATDASKIYGEDGIFQMSFVLGEAPATVESISPSDGSEIYTFYPEGGEEGLITFTFSDELDATIKDDVTVKVTYGDMEAGSYKEAYPDFTIEGKTVVVDIRGIMFPAEVEGGRGSSTAQQTQISVSIGGLKTVDGRDVQTNYPNAGTSSVMAFYNVVKEEITALPSWFPDQSQTLIFRQDKEVTFSINVLINYDGVSLTYWDALGAEKTKTLAAEDVPLVWNDEFECYDIVIPLSGTNFYNQGIIISIINPTLMNGDKMTFEARYNGSKTPTGINGVVVDEDADKVVKVYGIDGTFVKEGAAGTVLNGLPKGLYITNGKKVLVK